MENLPGQEENSSITFDSICIQHLRSTRRWTKFLSVLGFAFIGLMFMVMLFVSTRFIKDPGSIVVVLPLALMGLIYFFPIYYLWQFSRHSKLAIEGNDTESLGTAIKFLKRHYTFMGILIIVIIALYSIVAVRTFTVGGLPNPF